MAVTTPTETLPSNEAQHHPLHPNNLANDWSIVGHKKDGLNNPFALLIYDCSAPRSVSTRVWVKHDSTVDKR